jgi:hypothetical protein
MVSETSDDKPNFVTPVDSFLSFTSPHALPNMLAGCSYKDFLGNNLPDFLTDMPLIIH